MTLALFFPFMYVCGDHCCTLFICSKYLVQVCRITAKNVVAVAVAVAVVVVAVAVAVVVVVVVVVVVSQAGFENMIIITGFSICNTESVKYLTQSTPAKLDKRK